MSLWPVEDLATRQWITALYRARFVRHESTCEAWRDACRAVLSMRRSQRLSTHPSTWGAFVAVGDWR